MLQSFAEKNMKKCVLILILIMTAPYVWAQTVQRKSVMPGFFVPSGALKTKSEPEKLPPIKVINYEQQTTNDTKTEPHTVSIDNNYQSSPNQSSGGPAKISASTSQIKNNNSFLPPAITSNELPHAVEVNIADINPASKPENNPKTTQPKIISTSSSDTVNVSQQPTTTVDEQISKQPTAQTDQNINQSDSPKEVFARIMAEHWKDLNAISSGNYSGNIGLNKILADYKDQEHIF